MQEGGQKTWRDRVKKTNGYTRESSYTEKFDGTSRKMGYIRLLYKLWKYYALLTILNIVFHAADLEPRSTQSLRHLEPLWHTKDLTLRQIILNIPGTSRCEELE